MTCALKNRGPFKPEMVVQDGWLYSPNATSRSPRMVQIPFRMAPDCQYTLTDLGRVDPLCEGCSHKEAKDD